MMLTKAKESIAFVSLLLLILVPFLNPLHHFGVLGFTEDMLTVSCLALVLIATVLYCDKIIVPRYIILLLLGAAVLIGTTFFNTTYLQNRLNLSIWLISAGLVSICVYSLKYQYANTKLFQVKLAKALFFSIFIIAVLSFLSFYWANPLIKLSTISFYYSNIIRMGGFIGQPNLLAILFFLGIAAYPYLDKQIQNKYASLPYVVMLFFISYCLFATLSRVAVIALVVFVIYTVIKAIGTGHKKRAIKFSAIISLAYLTYHFLHPHLIDYAIEKQWIPNIVNSASEIKDASYNRATNIDHKLDEIQRALTIFSQHSLAGVGFGRYGYYSQQLTLAGWPVIIPGFPYHSHNIIAQVLAEFGLIGAGVLLLALVLVAKLLIGSYKREGHLLLFGLLLIFALNAMFEYALWNLNFAVLFFLLLASFTDDKALEITLLKTPLLKVAYGIFFAGFVVILLSRWSILKTIDTIFAAPENVIYAQAMTDDSLIGLDFSNIYLAGLKFSPANDKSYAEEVAKVEQWRPTDLVYYRKVQLDIGNEDSESIVNNINKALKLGSTEEILVQLMQADCQPDNKACKVGRAYIETLNK